MMLLFSNYYELSQNYTEGIELFPSAKVAKNDGARPTFDYKLPLSTAREVAKNAFGKTFSDNINIENDSLNYLNFNIADDYLNFNYKEVSNPKKYVILKMLNIVMIETILQYRINVPVVNWFQGQSFTMRKKLFLDEIIIIANFHLC